MRLETKEQEPTEFLKKRKKIKSGFMSACCSYGTCTTTESLQMLYSLIMVILRTSLQYDMLPTQPLLLIFYLEKNLYASWCCLEYSHFLWYEK